MILFDKNKKDKKTSNAAANFDENRHIEFLPTSRLSQLRQEIQTLDMQNYGSWSLAIKLIVHAVIVILILLIMWVFLISHTKDAIKVAEIRKESLLQTYQQMMFKTRHLAEYQKQLSVLSDNKRLMHEQLPKLHQQSSSSDLVEKVSQLSLLSNVEVKDIRVEQAIEQKTYIEEPIKIEVVGHYNDLGSFLGELVNLVRIVTVHDFKLTTHQHKQAGGEQALQLSLQLKAYQAKVQDNQDADASMQAANLTNATNSSDENNKERQDEP